MLAVAFQDLLPEALTRRGESYLGVLCLGMCALMLLEPLVFRGRPGLDPTGLFLGLGTPPTTSQKAWLSVRAIPPPRSWVSA